MSKKCLIVDDVDVSRYVAREILEQLGFVVDEAVDQDEAMTKLNSQKFDLIMLDWHLRKSQSVDFIPLIREIKGYDAVPIMLSTGVEMEKSLNDIKNLKVQSFIKKPLTLDGVKSELKQLLLL